MGGPKKWTDEIRMYLLGYVIFTIQKSGDVDLERAAQVVNRKWHSGATIFTAVAISRKLYEIANYVSQTGWTPLKEAISKGGLDSISSKFNPAELQLLQKFMGELATTDLALPIDEYNQQSQEYQGSSLTMEAAEAMNVSGTTSKTRSDLHQGTKRARPDESTHTSHSSNAVSAMDLVTTLFHQGHELPKVRRQLQETESQRRETEGQCKSLNVQLEEARGDLERKEHELNEFRITNTKLYTQLGLTEQILAHERIQLPTPLNSHNLAVASGSTFDSYNNTDQAQKIVDSLLQPWSIDRDSSGFPGTIEPKRFLGRWKECQDILASLTTQDISRPQAFRSRQVPDGFTSFLMKLFGTTRPFPIHDQGASFYNLKDLITPKVLQAYAMDLLCEQIFQTNRWHRTLSCESSIGMLAQYRKLHAARTGGLEFLQNFDAMAFKLMLVEVDEYFKGEVMPKKAGKIATQACQTLELFFLDDTACYPHPNDKRKTGLQACADVLMHLKLELLLDPKQYELKWILAGESFDAQTMECKGVDRRRAGGMKVTVCICPALLGYDPTPISQNCTSEYASVLVCNKSFFPSGDVPRNNRFVMAKSLVLVE